MLARVPLGQAPRDLERSSGGPLSEETQVLPSRRRRPALSLSQALLSQSVATVGRSGQQTGGAWPLGRSFASEVLSPFVRLFQNRK